MTTQPNRPALIGGRTPEERARLIRARRQALAAAAEVQARASAQPDPDVPPAGAPASDDRGQEPSTDTTLVHGPRPTVVRPRPVAVTSDSESENVVVPVGNRVLDPASREARAARLAQRRANLAQLPGARPEAAVPVPVSTPVRVPMLPDPDEEDEEDIELPSRSLSREREDAVMPALPQQKARRQISVPLISFLVMVIVPVIVASVYYFWFASDQYVSEFRFSIRRQDAAVNLSNNAAGGASQVDALQIMADNFVIIDYLRSRSALDELVRRVDFEHIYDTDLADKLTRLKPDATVEERLDYWQGIIDAAYDMTTGITTVTVRSFRPEDTLKVAQALVDMSEGLVNSLQARARNDAVAFFEGEVARAEERLATAQKAVFDFRNKNQITDPSSSAEGVIASYNKVQDDLVSMRAELASLLDSMKPNAPTVQVLKSRIAAAEVELGKLRSRIGNNNVAVDESGQRLSDVIDRFETLQREQQFAERIYNSSLTALEAARINTAMQHNYLATFIQPAMAHDSTYPNRILSILSILFIAVFVWIVVLLFGYAVRDHAI